MENKYYEIIRKALEKFYNRRIEIVSKIDIFKIIKHKNPYMYRAFGTNDAHDFVESILIDCQTSSDETIFGDFFEEIAIEIAKLSNNARKSSADSIDLEIWSEDEKNVRLYAIKSGTKVFNAQSRERQRQAFIEAQKRLKGIAVTPIVGYSYGRKNPTDYNKDNFIEEAGEVFWTDITGNNKFYLELIELVGDVADSHKIIFKNEWDKCINRQLIKFIKIFGKEDGGIDWQSIVKYSSSKNVDKELEMKIRNVKRSI
ncbi:MAG: PmeII family type II restriction endonuclease [Caloramator sp.]|nr:PmeII family type II restriction endonuclease [Caloramator sp.]